MPTIVDCPQSDFGQWTFYLFGVPVRVKIWFWAACLLTCYGRETSAEIVIWVAVCFASILLHEMGHVLAFRAFGSASDIVLYGFGGLVIPDRAPRSPLARLAVSLAGPAAGFCATALVLVAATASGASIHFVWRTLIPVLAVMPATGFVVAGTSTFLWYILLNSLLQVNFYWSLVNLLPVYPLDGGQTSRSLFEKYNPYVGRRKSLILSAAVAIVIAVVGALESNGYLIILFAVLAVASLQGLEESRLR